MEELLEKKFQCLLDNNKQLEYLIMKLVINHQNEYFNLGSSKIISDLKYKIHFLEIKNNKLNSVYDNLISYYPVNYSD
jgi:hypothetical protein